MFERFRGKERTTVVGLKLDANCQHLIDSSLSLAARTGMALKFTHGVLPWSSAPPIYAGEQTSQSIAMVAEQARHRDATQKMAELLKPHLAQQELSSSVLVGRPAETVTSEALASQSSLIVCGVKPVSHRFVPQGWSTALELMAEASLPVLVIPDHKAYDLAKDRLTVVAWDDLTEAAAEALPTAAELAGAMKNVDLRHVHVHKETKEELEAFADTMASLMASHRLDLEYRLNKETIAAETEQAILKQMQRRREVPDSFLKVNQVSFTQKVVFGDVLEQMSQLVKEHKPDLVVFGRHHFFHRHPFSFGKVPFHTMLNLEVPVLVAPHLAHLG